MRAQTQRRIDALHAEIARLVEMEKAYVRRTEPELTDLLLSVRENSISVAAWSPTMRANSVIATATFPKLGEGS